MNQRLSLWIGQLQSTRLGGGVRCMLPLQTFHDSSGLNFVKQQQSKRSSCVYGVSGATVYQGRDCLYCMFSKRNMMNMMRLHRNCYVVFPAKLMYMMKN